MFDAASMRQLVIAVGATLIAVVLHELAHGVVALALGDRTALLAGRLTLNPLAHIDPVRSLLLPIGLAVAQLATIGRIAFLFGGARPVPVNALALRLGTMGNPRRLMAVVAAAGPLANFMLAFAGGLLLYTGHATDFWMYFIIINLVLGIFNLIPLPPLDGGRIAVGLLPLGLARRVAGAERFGIIAIILLLFVLPTGLAQFGVRFDPLHEGLNAVLPWAGNLVLRATGHGDGF